MNKKIITLGVAAVAVIAIAITVIVISNPAKRFRNAFDAGKKFLLQEDWDNAIEQFEKAIKIDPNNPDAYDEAINTYLRAAEIKVDIPDYNAAKDYYEKADLHVSNALDVISSNNYEKAKAPLLKSVTDYSKIFNDLKIKIDEGLKKTDAEVVSNSDNNDINDGNNSGSNSNKSEGNTQGSSDNVSDNTASPDINSFEDFKEAMVFNLPMSNPYVVSYSLYLKLYGPTINSFEANASKFEESVTGDEAIDMCNIYRKIWIMYAETNQLGKAKEIYEKWTSLSAKCNNPNTWNLDAGVDEYGRIVSIAGNTTTFNDESNRPAVIANNDGTVNEMTYDSEGRVVKAVNQYTVETYEYAGNTAIISVSDKSNPSDIHQSTYTIDESTGVASRN